jgi:hypothetical protein
MFKEPAVIINGLFALAQQVLPLMVVVGLLSLPDTKLAGWVSIIGLISAFVSTALIRQNVVPTEKANAQIQTAIDTPKGGATVEQVIAETDKRIEKGEV